MSSLALDSLAPTVDEEEEDNVDDDNDDDDDDDDDEKENCNAGGGEDSTGVARQGVCLFASAFSSSAPKGLEPNAFWGSSSMTT